MSTSTQSLRYGRAGVDSRSAAIDAHMRRQTAAAAARAAAKVPAWTATRRNQRARPFALTSAQSRANAVVREETAPRASTPPQSGGTEASSSSSPPVEIGAALEARLTRLQQGFADELRRVERHADERKAVSLRAQASLLHEKHEAERESWRREREELLAIVGVVRAELAARDHARVTARAAAQAIVASLASLERRMGVPANAGSPAAASPAAPAAADADAVARAVEANGHSIVAELALFRQEAAVQMRQHVEETNRRSCREVAELMKLAKREWAAPLAAQREIVDRLRAEVVELRATTVERKNI